MKRVLKFGAAAIVGALALSACGGSGNTGSNGDGAAKDPAALETTIKILAPSYSDSSKADWDAITAEFNKKYPKVKVELQIEGW